MGVSSIAFTYNNATPTIGITAPATGRETNLATLSGTATDAVTSDLAVVQVRVQNLSALNRYADPAAAFTFSQANPDLGWFNAGSVSAPLWTNWSVSSAIVYTSGNQYSVQARVRNQAGTYSTTYSTMVVVYDVDPPLTTTLLPVAFSTISSLPTLTGASADTTPTNPGTVSNLRVRLTRLTDGYYWNGAGWGPGVAQLTTVEGVVINVSSWTLSTNLPTTNNLPSGLQDGVSYYLTTSGIDNANPVGNTEAFNTPVRASTFTVDLTGPSAKFTAPVNLSIVSSLAQIRGTATDALAGITSASQIEVAIQENGPGAACWNGQIGGGSTFTAAACGPTYYPITNLGVGGTFAGGVWSMNVPTLTSQYGYKLWVRGHDNATPVGNVTSGANISSVTFTYNTNLPSASFTFPPSLPATAGNRSVGFTVYGIASDNFGVSYTSVAIQEADTGMYYDSATSTFSSVAQKFSSAPFAGSAPNYTFSWVAPIPAPSNGRNYNVYPYVENNSGLSQIGSSILLKWDTVPPASSVASPSNGQFSNGISSVTGVASDPGASSAGVGGTQIQIQRLSDNSCWNGAAFGALCTSQTTWLTPVAGANWTVNSGLPPVNNTAGGLQDGLAYAYSSRAFDVAGNTQTAITSNLFHLDLSSPTGAVISPLNNSDLPTLAMISGTAVDAAPGLLAFPQISIYDIPNGTYWNGATFAAGRTWNIAKDSQTAVGGVGDGSVLTWHYDTSAVPWGDGFARYLIETKVLDAAGNFAIASSTFSFDKTPPLSNITYPDVNGLTFSSMTAILGTSTDITSPVSLVKVRMFYVTAGTTYYFSPVPPHWGSTDPGPVTIGGASGPSGTSNPWSFNSVQVPDFAVPGNVNFVWKDGTHDGADGHTFYVVTIASDAAGNSQTVLSTRSFTFDNVPPTSGPTAPIPNSAYNSLATVSGTSTDDVSGVGAVAVSIYDKDAARWFNGGGFSATSEQWLAVLPSNLFKSSWVFVNGALSFTTQHHYVVKSSATDTVGNNQTIVGQALFLFDTDPPTSAVTNPANLVTYGDTKIIIGTSADPGYSSLGTGVDGTGSGVYPGAAPTWQQGAIEFAVFRDTAPLISGGPIAFPPADSTGFFWNGSTWVAASGGPVWVPATFTDAFGNWQYAGLVCPNPNPTNQPCWVHGDPYMVWSRSHDNAGNVQSIIQSGPRFFVSGIASAYQLSISSDPSTAGNQIQLTVKAVDNQGFLAPSYAGSVDFYVDGDYNGSGPEVMGPAVNPDATHGFPVEYAFNPVLDAGQHSFGVILRKAGARTIRVFQNDHALVGSLNVTILRNAATRVQLIADTNATCDGGNQYPAPGVVTAGSEGRAGAPVTYTAGQNIQYCARVTDDYYNLYLGSATSVNITDTDPNNAPYPNGADQTVVFTGSTTFFRAYVTASAGQVVSASGAGIFPNPSNPSTPVPIVGAPAQELLALLPGETLVPGKFAVPPLGKTGTPSDVQAGSGTVVTVYAVDQFQNPDPTVAWPVTAKVYTDPFTPVPAPQTLQAGVTTFTFTPFVVGLSSVEVQSALAPTNTFYYTPNPFQVWWSTPTKLQLLVSGQTAAPGKAPFDANPTTGGRALTVPNTLTAGVTTTITVNLVDNYFNVTKGTTPFVTYTSSFTMPLVQLNFLNDPNIQGRSFAPNPYQRTLISGTTTFAFFAVTRNAALQLQAADTQLTGTNYSTDTVSNIPVISSTPLSLIVRMPGENYAEGTVSGKTGSPSTLTAGTSYTLVVRSVDQYNNQSDAPRLISLTANDIYAGVPAAQTLALGQTVFANFLPSAATGNLVLSASDVSGLNPPLTGQTATNIQVIPGTPDRMIVLLAGQTLVPGKVVAPLGVTGTPVASTAGVTFAAQAYAADSRYNAVSSVSGKAVTFTSDDAFAPSRSLTMNGGVASPANLILYTAGTRTLTATDTDPLPTLSAGVSGPLPLLPNGPTRLRVLTPTETAVPGDPGRGRSGPAYSAQAGFSFTAEVDITDAFWNLEPGTTQLVTLISDDPFATITPVSQIVTTSAAFTVTLKRAGTTVLTALDGDPALPALALDSATAISVMPGIPTRLLTVVTPTESFSQGSPTGKSGTAPAQTAGASFQVQVGVIDAFFNLVPGRAATVQVNTPTDLYADVVATAAINTVNGITPPMTVTLRRATTGQYLASSDFLNSGLASEPQSSTFTVQPANPRGYQLVLPGQTAVPGSGAYPNGGIVGTVSTATAGTPFQAVVNLVDRFMNVYTAPSSLPQVALNTSDPYDINPGFTTLNNGTGSVPLAVTLVTKSTGTVLTVIPDSSVVCTDAPGNLCRADAPAAVSSAFKVYASTAVGLQVILPGETQHPGKCTALGCRALTAGEGLPGKDGTPTPYVVGGAAQAVNVYLVDAYFNPATELAAAFQDTNPPAVMPTVRVSFPQETNAAFVQPGAAPLILGSRLYAYTPLTASLAYTVMAATTAASASTWPAVLSAQEFVYPGVSHHLSWSNLVAVATAGVPINGTLTALDQYGNVLSTGPNAYAANVALAAELFGGNQDPVFTPTSNVAFSSAVDQGVKNLLTFVTLKKAGSRYLQAFENGNAAVNSEVSGYSVRPYISVLPAAPDSVKVVPTNGTAVSAGQSTPSNPGRQAITGQLTDAFDNPITAGGTVYVQVVGVTGTSGYLSLDYGVGPPINVGLSTTVFTDSVGRVGVSTPTITYFVSSHAGDSARIWIGTITAPANLTQYQSTQKDISGLLTTVGGTPSQIVFLSSPSAALVGINELAGSGGQYQIQALDDFNNITTVGFASPLLLQVVETSVHTSRGYTLGTFGTSGDYGFRDTGNTQFITSVVIGSGVSQASFRYHDRMSSYAGVSPATNTGAGGRPGTWTIQIYENVTLLASHSLRMDPDIPRQVAFGNPQNSEVAGQTVDFANQSASFQAQLQDGFGNPSITTQTVTVALSTLTRVASRANDYVGFSLSSGAFFGSRVSAPSFYVSTKTVDVPLNRYETTFYFMDTSASNLYASGASTFPVIGLSAPFLTSAQQPVTVLSDSIDGIAISTGGGQALPAGATSQIFVYETRDIFGNPSPVRPGQDLGKGWVQLRVQSDSLGQVQTSTPDAYGFVNGSAVSYLNVGASATSFFLIDTLLTQPGSTHTVSVTGITYPGWNVAKASYTVTPGIPAQIGWATPPRRLIAGTTLQYELGVPTNTVVAVQLLDKFGNVTTSAQTYFINYNAVNQNSTYGGINPNAVIVATAPSSLWTNLGTQNLTVSIPGGAGLSAAPMYFWSTIAGGATIYAQAQLGGSSVFAPTTQLHLITPGPASYMTLHHPFTPANPLKVGVPGTLTLKARDLFGNVASGDVKNGNYFTGVVDFGSSGSTNNVTLIDLTNSASYHIFVPAEGGVFTNLGLIDTYQEVLQVAATAYGNSSIWGITNDGFRPGLPAQASLRSDGNVELAGIVVSPSDLAPEKDPTNPSQPPSAKVALGITRTTLNQGDGLTPVVSPDPIPMLRLSMGVAATQPSALSATLSSMRVQSRVENTLNNAHIYELGLYFDAPGSGHFDAINDVLLGTGAYDGAGSWFFGTPAFGQLTLDTLTPGVATTLSATQRNYFLTVRIASAGYATNELPASFGLQMPTPSNITLAAGSQVGVALNNFAVFTTTSEVDRQPAQINVVATDINAWWTPPSLPTSSYTYVNQGTPNVGVLRLDLWTDAFSGVLSQITINHSGTGFDANISRVRMYLDTQPNGTTPGDGLFEYSIDHEVAETTFPPGETHQAQLVVTNPTGINGTVTTSTKTYFLVYDIDPSATPGLTHGMTLQNGNVVALPGSGVIKPISPTASTQVVVNATPDLVVLTDWNRQGVSSGTATNAVPSKLIQNDTSVPVAKLTLRANSGSAEWTGLKLDRWLPSTINGGNGSYNPLFAQTNKASDVTNIKVWIDQNGDGLLNISTDSQVSPLNTTIHKFPFVPLASAIYSSGPTNGAAVIPVTGMLAMFPTDNPMPADTFNRLVINDGQIDETRKEIVYCYGVNLALNVYTNCWRGQEGTGARDYPAGVIVSGPARIPIQSLIGNGGQSILTTKVDYFVTFDVDPLATVSPQANLGIAIGVTTGAAPGGPPNYATSYFQITAPKQLSVASVGIPPLGLTDSFVSNVAKYPDQVRVVSTDTVDPAIGPYLQQRSSVAVAVINLQTKVSDASMRWILINATGTATSGGAIVGDVDQVSLWYDAPNNGIFNSGSDVLVGTGTFGNYQGLPLVAQINMFNPVHVVTNALAPQPQRYFVVYHMSATAQPTDPATQAPRTVGVQFLPTLLPTNSPLSDNPFLNALTLPNSFDPTSPLPYTSKMRTIIPSPQVMTVVATPYFSTSSGTFAAPTLQTPIIVNPAGTVESSWVLSSTAGLPVPAFGATNYMIVDGEIVGYSGFLAAVPGITNVVRGSLNTVPTVHAVGSYLSPQVAQGQNNVAALRLDLSSSLFQIELTGLDLNRILPIGMNGADSDVTAIHIYKALGGIFHRDPASGLDVSDTQLGQSVFGAPPETSGRVLLPINDPSIGSPGYMLVDSTGTTLYVAFDISASAKFSYPTLTPPNEVTGVVAPDPTRFKLAPTNAGHTTVFVGTTPVASPTFVLAPTVNTVNIVVDQLSGNTAMQNDKNVPMMRLTLSTDRNSAIVQRLRVDRVGSPLSLDSDITAIKVWRDSNGNGNFDAADSTAGVNGDYPNRISFGNDTFSTGTVTINLKTPILVTTTPAAYFVTYDISQFAAEGNQEGAQVVNPGYLTAQVPNVVIFPGAPFASNPLLTISKVTSRVTLGVNDIASNVVGVSQAQANVGVVRLNLTTDIALAPWRSIRLERGGGSQDPTKPLGRNTDVKFVRVYKDINQNDSLDSNDINISEVNTTLAVAVSSTVNPPFDLVVTSTAGFPVDNVGNPVQGRIYLNSAELMTFTGPGCQGAFTPGVDNITGKPCLAIASRGDQLGTAATPRLNLSVGAQARKVDVFDQTNDANVQSLVTLNADQYVGPTAQTYFIAYDIGDAAVANDLVNVTVRDPSWVGMPRGDIVLQNLLTGITRTNPLGAATTSYPYVGSNIAITPITLKVSGFSSAPGGTGQGDTNVPILQINMATNLDFVNIGQIRLKQLGTFATATTAFVGDGDAAVIKVWLDANNSGVFNPAADVILGQLNVSTAGAFSNGVALVPLVFGGIPYLNVSTAGATLFVTADIGYTDRAGGSTLGHALGFQLEKFSDLLAPNAAPIVAAPDAVQLPPVVSKLALIAPLTVPGVSISSALPPIIVTRAGPGVPSQAVGYPAYAKMDPANCNNGKDPQNPRNNICLDANKNPIPDMSKWMCPDGTTWCGNGACTITTCLSAPLIDVNGDGRPDNFSMGQSTRPDQVSLLGDGTPTRDMTGTGILDVDINQDGIPDVVIFPAGATKPQFRIGLDAADPGNLAKTAPDPGQGLAPTSWSPSQGQLSFNLPMIGTSGYYQVAVGKFYDDPIGITHKWSTVTVSGVAGMSAASFRTRAIGAPITAAVLGNLVLGVPNVARLTQTLTQNTTSFTVDNIAAFGQKATSGGLFYVGSEIMRLQTSPSAPNTMNVLYQAGDPPPFNGRGLHGSAPIIHTQGEVVSDDGAILFAQYVSAQGATSPAEAMFVYRVDPLPPTTPGPAIPLEQGKPSYAVRWTPSTQPVSGVLQYEVQERGGAPTDLSANVIWRTINIIPARLNTYNVGDPTYPGESPRTPGEFFTYRVRAVSGAGVVSSWSPATTAANTGLTNLIIAGVSNFPNPFDSRKGGNSGKTQITYILNADSSVTIQIYDALGYLTKTIGCPAGTNGGSSGQNFVDWDGRNDAGVLVSKGGYTARIKVKAPSGTATVIRKIGVIH
ncbi:MAG: hypothetical protein ACHQ51_02395 [Elusimicrobiota bacterium]